MGVHWLIAFYGTMIAVNALRVKKFGMADKRMAIGFFEPLPLAYFPYVATPFLFMYSADFAYGTKAERLNVETKNILLNESHWFNKPIVLPKYLEPHYRALQEKNAVELRALGEPPEEDWATFSDDMTDAEILKHSA